jgi:hypothetical protein
LRSLTLGSCIDFEELEEIVKGLSALQHLYLEGGFDDINGQGTVSSTTPHSARLKTLLVGTTRDYISITDIQLAWLIEPAVETLVQLDLSIISANGGQWANFAGAVAAPVPPCFASGLIADQVRRMARLEKLAFRDIQGLGALVCFPPYPRLYRGS